LRGNGKGKVEELRLRNGLKVILKEARSAPVVSVWCWYKVGSSDEAPGITGISHWLEHMNFKGTRAFSKSEMKSLIERRGGYWNGYTWIDQTTYFETLPKEHLDLALRLESERMNASLISRDEFNSERTVILSELRGGENNPESLLDREVNATVFQAHGYRWPTVGWEPDVKRITHGEMVDFYRANYVPANATLVVVGDFATRTAVRKIRSHFGDIPPGTMPERFRTPEAEQRGERRVELEGGGATSYFHVAYRAPSVHDEDVYPLLVLDAVLGGAKGISLWSYDGEVRRSSPLYQKMIDSRLATGVRSFYIPTKDPFLYYLTVTAAEGVPVEKVEKKLFRLVESMAVKKPTAREMQKAKNQIRATHVFQSDSVTEVAHQLGYFETIHEYRFFESFLKRIEAVTPEDVRDVAERLLRKKNRTIGIYKPSRNGRKG